MSTWNDLFDKAMSVANAAGKKTGEVVESSKLKLQVLSLNNDIEEAYQRLGTLVYRANKTGVENDQPVADVIQELDELLGELGGLEDKIAQLRQVKKCSNCGASCPVDAHFCSRCGMILNKRTEPEAEEPAEYVDAEIVENPEAAGQTEAAGQPEAASQPEEAQEEGGKE